MLETTTWLAFVAVIVSIDALPGSIDAGAAFRATVGAAGGGVDELVPVPHEVRVIEAISAMQTSTAEQKVEINVRIMARPT